MTAQRARYALQPSYRLAGVLLAVHGAAAAAVCAARPGPATALIAILIAALGISASWQRALLRGKTAPRTLEFGTSMTLVMESADGTRCMAVAGRRRYVGRLGVTLGFERPCRRGLLFVAADMLPPRAFRALRLWALWGRWPESALGASQGSGG